MIFTKTLFFSVIFFFQIKICPFKKFNPAKKISLCKKNNSAKQTHSVKDQFYSQFSFAANEQIAIFTPLYKLCQMKDDKERNYFSLRTMFWKCLPPMLKCF